jgi:gamma-glutamylcyclotransferase (GGCT)/AIG2-like uncharacterized protein YtfP
VSILYFAYGMNTNSASMAQRCPAARAIGAAQLLGHRFRFAYHADVQVDRRSDTDGVLWSITEPCLIALDLLESYPTYYDRKWAQVLCQGQEHRALVYYMQPGNRNRAPSLSYFDMVCEGYKNFDVPQDQLWQSVTKSTTKSLEFARLSFG